ncbi:MAG: glycosyltransferase family 2 protein [Patescibacteria group bacterium]
MKIIVIIPAYNEAKKIFNVVRGLVDVGYEVVVADDGSRDNTAMEAERAGAKVLRHIINRGYGAALATGNDYAVKNNYDMAVHFDADGQHDVEDIKKLIQPIIENQADVVLGSRFISDPNTTNYIPPSLKLWRAGRMTRMGLPFIRKILLKAAVLFTWFVSGVKLTDAHNGLRALSRQALTKIDCRQDGMSYASEIIDQIGEHKLRYQEVGVAIKYTDYSLAKGENNIKKVLLGLRFIWEKMVK